VVSTAGPQVRVGVHVGSDLPPAVADANQLEMAILNLAANARDAMPAGGTLTLSAAREEVGPGHLRGLPPGTYLRLWVEDTGHGMDEATLSRAVEPFFSTKGTGRGTGLGLSMVHGLALQLGGALGLESEPGAGTRVTLWLPAAPRGPARRGRAGPAAPARAVGAALLVDDEPLVREATADMLAELGYRVTPASNADEALRLVEAGLVPDLLITDHLMPGMTGTDLALRLRGLRPGLSVLIVSGFAEASGLSPDLPRLAKPFRRDELAASLERLRRA
jgi:CheY-like chemotaxis protein